jgi:hypothetical protein
MTIQAHNQINSRRCEQQTFTSVLVNYNFLLINFSKFYRKHQLAGVLKYTKQASRTMCKKKCAIDREIENLLECAVEKQ